MIIFAIILIGTCFGFPAFVAWLQRRRLKKAEREIEAFIRDYQEKRK